MAGMKRAEGARDSYKLSIDNKVWQINRQVASGIVVALVLVGLALSLGWKGLLAGSVVALVTRLSDWLEWRAPS